MAIEHGSECSTCDDGPHKSCALIWSKIDNLETHGIARDRSRSPVSEQPRGAEVPMSPVSCQLSPESPDPKAEHEESRRGWSCSPHVKSRHSPAEVKQPTSPMSWHSSLRSPESSPDEESRSSSPVPSLHSRSSSVEREYLGYSVDETEREFVDECDVPYQQHEDDWSGEADQTPEWPQSSPTWSPMSLEHGVIDPQVREEFNQLLVRAQDPPTNTLSALLQAHISMMARFTESAEQQNRLLLSLLAPLKGEFPNGVAFHNPPSPQ